MPSVLREGQHELLLPDETPLVLFGTEDTGYITTTYPTLEGGDGSTGDNQRPREDGVSFGEDYQGGKTYTFEVGVLKDRGGSPHAAVDEAVDVLEAAWSDERFRQRSWDYGILRNVVAGRVTRCYGRPRRFSASPTRLAHRGYVPAVMDFAVGDGRFYDDQEQQVTASLVLSPEGGMVAPFVFPLTTTAESLNETLMTVGGAKSTWVTVEFRGPVTNPSVKIGDLFTIGLHGTIPAGKSVTVDPRPWVRSVQRSDGANQAGKLSYDTPPLRRLLASPGAHRVAYRGEDPTGTSTCRVRWRNARTRP